MDFHYKSSILGYPHFRKPLFGYKQKVIFLDPNWLRPPLRSSGPAALLDATREAPLGGVDLQSPNDAAELEGRMQALVAGYLHVCVNMRDLCWYVSEMT